MIQNLTKQQSDALHAHGDGFINLIDPVTNRLYVLVDAATFAELDRRRTHQAIHAGLQSVNSGGGQPLDVAMAELRAKYQSPSEG